MTTTTTGQSPVEGLLAGKTNPRSITTTHAPGKYKPATSYDVSVFYGLNELNKLTDAEIQKELKALGHDGWNAEADAAYSSFVKELTGKYLEHRAGVFEIALTGEITGNIHTSAEEAKYIGKRVRVRARQLKAKYKTTPAEHITLAKALKRAADAAYDTIRNSKFTYGSLSPKRIARGAIATAAAVAVVNGGIYVKDKIMDQLDNTNPLAAVALIGSNFDNIQNIQDIFEGLDDGITYKPQKDFGNYQRNGGSSSFLSIMNVRGAPNSVVSDYKDTGTEDYQDPLKYGSGSNTQPGIWDRIMNAIRYIFHSSGTGAKETIDQAKKTTADQGGANLNQKFDTKTAPQISGNSPCTDGVTRDSSGVGFVTCETSGAGTEKGGVSENTDSKQVIVKPVGTTPAVSPTATTPKVTATQAKIIPKSTPPLGAKSAINGLPAGFDWNTLQTHLTKENGGLSRDNNVMDVAYGAQKTENGVPTFYAGFKVNTPGDCTGGVFIDGSPIRMEHQRKLAIILGEDSFKLDMEYTKNMGATSNIKLYSYGDLCVVEVPELLNFLNENEDTYDFTATDKDGRLTTFKVQKLQKPSI